MKLMSLAGVSAAGFYSRKTILELIESKTITQISARDLICSS